MHDMPRDDREAEMAKSELYRAAKYAMKLHEMIQAGDELEGWTQSKITKASDYLASVFHYLDYELKFKHGNDNQMDMMPMGGEPQEKMAFSLAERLESAMRRDKHDAIIAEAKKKNDGNLANNAKPYDKVTRGDVVAGRLGKDEMGGKAKKVKEGNDGNLANNAKPYDKVTRGDVIAGRLGKDAMGGKKDKKVKESDTTEGAMSDLDADRKDRQYQSRQARTTMKHVKNPTPGEKKAAKDIKPGIAGYKDRVAMLKSAERDGRLKETSVDEGWDDMVKAVKDKEKEKGTGKFDKKVTSTGTQYTKRDLPGQDTADDADEKARKRKAKIAK